MQRFRRARPDVRLEMTPLIDVVFLLLTFFLFSLVLLVRADTLEVSLPAVGIGSSSNAPAAITIAITEDGSVAVNGRPVESVDVPDEVLALRAERPDAPVYLAADRDGRSGDLLGLIDRLTTAGVTEFTVLGRSGDAGVENARGEGRAEGGGEP